MYLLDTNILSELIKKHPSPAVVSQLRSKPAHILFTSCICVMELRCGSLLRNDAVMFWEKVTREIISRVNIVPITESEVFIAGNILSDLRQQGQIIGLEDVLIAASDLANQYIVVTANSRRFSRIKALKVENWIEAV